MISFVRLALPPICLIAICSCSHAPVRENAKSTSANITVTGKKVTAEDLKDSEKLASFPKSEIMAVVNTGQPACAHGTTGARFDVANGLSLGNESLSVDELIKRVIAAKDAGKTSCLVVYATSYNKPAFDQLDAALVVPQQISLMWKTPDQSK